MRTTLLCIVSLIFLFLSSCDPKECCDMPAEKEVTFTYQGKTETYGIVEQVYTKDGVGAALPTPVKKRWLDRNLGAQRVAQSQTDAQAAGHLFQWGRNADGHQLTNSDTTLTLAGSPDVTLSKYIAAPFGSDWLSTPDNSLWNGVSNENCPCPPGWRVPTRAELSMEMFSWTEINLNGAYTSPLKWVPTGNRDNHGTFRYLDAQSAFVWSSHALPDSRAEMMAIISTDTSEMVTSPRVFAGAVRCIEIE